jgi:SAM-dependent methyltransferase
VAIDRTRRSVFGTTAELYAEARPSYPPELVADVLRLSGIPAEARILEIGCGTGHATLLFAQRAYHVLPMELGERLAALAAERCRDYPRVSIRRMAFEDWPVEAGAFALAISTDAFHWIRPEIGHAKVAQALKPSNSAALFWFVPVDPDTDWSRAIDDVYRALAPDIENPYRSFTAEWLASIIPANFAASECLGAVSERQYRWTEACPVERYLKLLQTYSGHTVLSMERRQELYSGMEGVLEQEGGRITVAWHVALFFARLKPT